MGSRSGSSYIPDRGEFQIHGLEHVLSRQELDELGGCGNYQFSLVVKDGEGGKLPVKTHSSRRASSSSVRQIRSNKLGLVKSIQEACHDTKGIIHEIDRVRNNFDITVKTRTKDFRRDGQENLSWDLRNLRQSVTNVNKHLHRLLDLLETREQGNNNGNTNEPISSASKRCFLCETEETHSSFLVQRESSGNVQNQDRKPPRQLNSISQDFTRPDVMTSLRHDTRVGHHDDFSGKSYNHQKLPPNAPTERNHSKGNGPKEHSSQTSRISIISPSYTDNHPNHGHRRGQESSHFSEPTDTPGSSRSHTSFKASSSIGSSPGLSPDQLLHAELAVAQENQPAGTAQACPICNDSDNQQIPNGPETGMEKRNREGLIKESRSADLDRALTDINNLHVQSVNDSSDDAASSEILQVPSNSSTKKSGSSISRQDIRVQNFPQTDEESDHRSTTSSRHDGLTNSARFHNSLSPERANSPESISTAAYPTTISEPSLSEILVEDKDNTEPLSPTSVVSDRSRNPRIAESGSASDLLLENNPDPAEPHDTDYFPGNAHPESMLDTSGRQRRSLRLGSPDRPTAAELRCNETQTEPEVINISIAESGIDSPVRQQRNGTKSRTLSPALSKERSWGTESPKNLAEAEQAGPQDTMDHMLQTFKQYLDQLQSLVKADGHQPYPDKGANSNVGIKSPITNNSRNVSKTGLTTTKTISTSPIRPCKYREKSGGGDVSLTAPHSESSTFSDGKEIVSQMESLKMDDTNIRQLMEKVINLLEKLNKTVAGKNNAAQDIKRATPAEESVTFKGCSPPSTDFVTETSMQREVEGLKSFIQSCVNEVRTPDEPPKGKDLSTALQPVEEAVHRLLTYQKRLLKEISLLNKEVDKPHQHAARSPKLEQVKERPRTISANSGSPSVGKKRKPRKLSLSPNRQVTQTVAEPVPNKDSAEIIKELQKLRTELTKFCQGELSPSLKQDPEAFISRANECSDYKTILRQIQNLESKLPPKRIGDREKLNQQEMREPIVHKRLKSEREKKPVVHKIRRCPTCATFADSFRRKVRKSLGTSNALEKLKTDKVLRKVDKLAVDLNALKETLNDRKEGSGSSNGQNGEMFRDVANKLDRLKELYKVRFRQQKPKFRSAIKKRAPHFHAPRSSSLGQTHGSLLSRILEELKGMRSSFADKPCQSDHINLRALQQLERLLTLRFHEQPGGQFRAAYDGNNRVTPETKSLDRGLSGSCRCATTNIPVELRDCLDRLKICQEENTELKKQLTALINKLDQARTENIPKVQESQALSGISEDRLQACLTEFAMCKAENERLKRKNEEMHDKVTQLQKDFQKRMEEEMEKRRILERQLLKRTKTTSPSRRQSEDDMYHNGGHGSRRKRRRSAPGVGSSASRNQLVEILRDIRDKIGQPVREQNRPESVPLSPQPRFHIGAQKVPSPGKPSHAEQQLFGIQDQISQLVNAVSEQSRAVGHLRELVAALRPSGRQSRERDDKLASLRTGDYRTGTKAGKQPDTILSGPDARVDDMQRFIRRQAEEIRQLEEMVNTLQSNDHRSGTRLGEVMPELNPAKIPRQSLEERLKLLREKNDRREGFTENKRQAASQTTPTVDHLTQIQTDINDSRNDINELRRQLHHSHILSTGELPEFSEDSTAKRISDLKNTDEASRRAATGTSGIQQTSDQQPRIVTASKATDTAGLSPAASNTEPQHRIENQNAEIQPLKTDIQATRALADERADVTDVTPVRSRASAVLPRLSRHSELVAKEQSPTDTYEEDTTNRESLPSRTLSQRMASAIRLCRSSSSVATYSRRADRTPFSSDGSDCLFINRRSCQLDPLRLFSPETHPCNLPNLGELEGMDLQSLMIRAENLSECLKRVNEREFIDYGDDINFCTMYGNTGVVHHG